MCVTEVMARRLKAMGAPGYEDGFALRLMPERLLQPLRRKKPTTFFVNSMSDLFHEDVPDRYIDDVLHVIGQTPQHTYQILTKRADRLPEFFRGRTLSDNIWLGVSVEDKAYGVPRIDHLRRVDAKVRFLSVEPLLEDVGVLNLSGIHWVIVGGESGSRARPMNSEWVENVRNQCYERNKKANGRSLNGRVYEEYPRVNIIAIS